MSATVRPSAAADLRLFHTSQGAHVFVADGSRIYDLDHATAQAIDLWLHGTSVRDAIGLDAFERVVDPSARRWIDGRPARPPALRSLSLNVAQSCNMTCHYCYADAGRFGGRPRMMEPAVGEAAVDGLIRESEPGADLLLGFMGGEPLLNRALVHHAARYGAEAAARAGRRMRFSITTNATLMTPEDARLFAALPFTVQVSIDGQRAANDAARPMANGAGSYDRIMDALRLMEAIGRPRHLAARVTVTPLTGELPGILDHLVRLGFDEVGFAAVLVSPSPRHAFAPADFPRFLDGMIACGRRALAELSAGRPYSFGNFETAMREIHRGTHRPYPCGAGAAYLSANAEGHLYACHRLIDDPRFAMGDVRRGSDVAARTAHLTESHVDRMEPCRGCWARYLCGGGCYHEVSRRGRVGCDYIRGWLDFCLRAYVELMAVRPEYFAAAAGETHEPISSPTTVSS
jgi:uncharacterized protein